MAWKVEHRLAFKPHSPCCHSSLVIFVYSIQKELHNFHMASDSGERMSVYVTNIYLHLISIYYVPCSIPDVNILFYLYQVVSKISNISVLLDVEEERFQANCRSVGNFRLSSPSVVCVAGICYLAEEIGVGSMLSLHS